MSVIPTSPLNVLKPADYGSDQDVRWCPGCGDYSILAQMKKVCAKLQMDRSKTVFISGIGCSSRFPYYMNTYGFHSIHGRAPTFATGLKLARPDLTVWMVTGDGDGDVVSSIDLRGVGVAERDRQGCSDDAGRRELPRLVEDVHVAAKAATESGGALEDLREEGTQGHTLGERVAVGSVRGGDPIRRSKHVADADRNGLLALALVQRARDLAL